MDEKEYIVYQHINKTNGMQYIGITCRQPEERWKEGGGYRTSPKFYAAIQKYGWDNFEHNILEAHLTKDEACEKEQYYIQFFNTMSPNGYNLTSGGEMTILSEESRHKKSLSMMGNQNGAGHPCSDEKKKRIGDAQRGRKFSEERRQHLSEAKKGKSTGKCTEERRQLIIKNKKDKKPVYCIETNTVYESIHECARQLSLQATLICAVCRGRLKTTGGYHFQYH